MKSVLLLTHQLEDFAGSEINIYELAITFQELGYSVEIGTFTFGNPIKQIFHEQNLNVKNLLQDEKLDSTYYDLIWAQHTPVLNFILFELHIDYKDIIYSSLSPFEPLEVPPLHLKEYISLFLANSLETKKAMVQEGLSSEEITVFTNSVRANFLKKESKKPSGTIKSVAIISNHLPDELYALNDILLEHDIESVIYGIGGKKEFVTPEILIQYDVVITIGKTVQFALTLGIPVYIYDRYGGDGWVSIENIDSLETYNFSGRYKKEKYSAQELFDSIIDGYIDALKNKEGLKIVAHQRYSLTDNINKILQILNTKEPQPFGENSFKYMKRVSQYYTKLLKRYQELQHQKQRALYVKELELSQAITKVDTQEKELQKHKVSLLALEEHKKILEAKIVRMYNSKRWKLFYPLDIFREKAIQKRLFVFIKSNRILRNFYHKLPLSNESRWKLRQFINTGKLQKADTIILAEDTLTDIKKGKICDSLPLVSIIIQCYNQGNYLWQSVPSALASYSGETEVIVVNDGSTDPKTLKSLREIELYFPDITILHKANGGLSSARNRGLKSAHGEYIQFLDADDILVPGKIDTQICLKEGEKSLLVSNYLTCDDSCQKFFKTEETIKGCKHTLNDFLFKWERGLSIPIHCGLFPKEIFKEIEFDTELSAKEDWVFWVSLLKNGYKIEYIDTHSAIYRVHTTSMVRRSFVTMSQQWELAYNKIAKLLKAEQKIHFLHESKKWLQRYYQSNPNYQQELKTANSKVSHTISEPSIDMVAIEQLVSLFHNFKEGKPLISVIIPIYNHYNYLFECFESLSKQGSVEIELICINDNSSDKRIQHLLAQMREAPSITIIEHSENRGISYSQNEAVSKAKGDYIAFLDCDDYLKNNALEQIYKEIQNAAEVDYFFTDRSNIDAHGKLLYNATYHTVASSNGIKSDLLDRMIASHLKVIKKDTYLQVGGSNKKMSGIQDWDLALKIAEIGKMKYINKPLYCHRIHKNSVTSSESVAQYKKTNILRREYAIKWLNREENTIEYEKILTMLKLHKMDTLFNLDEVATFSPKNIDLNNWYAPDALKSAFGKNKFCLLDARGAIDEPLLEFIKDYNSYLDCILCDKASLSSQIIGTLWSEKIIWTPLKV